MVIFSVFFFNKEFDALSALPQPLPRRENPIAKVKQAGGNDVLLIRLPFSSKEFFTRSCGSVVNACVPHTLKLGAHDGNFGLSYII